MFTSLLAGLLAATCPAGQTVTADTAGQCCWPDQAWSRTQQKCVGVPACPSGQIAQGETCVVACPAGQLANEDTGGHCCWPNQAWAQSRGVCVGVPQCPQGLVASAETCVAQQYVAPPPPVRPPDAPIAAPDVSVAGERTRLQGVLTGLRAEHASVGFGANIVLMVLGWPAIPVGIVLFVGGIESEQIGFTILGIVMTAVALPVALIATLDLGSKVRRRSALSTRIRDTEAQLRALDGRAFRLPLQGAVFALSSPVFEF